MRLGLAAARRFILLATAIALLIVAPMTPAATAESASPYTRLGHAWMSVNTNLRASSHISAWAIDEYLARNTPLRGLGHAFKAAEAKYDVNALYLLAHAMHETGFGTSYIGLRYHNLFGWNAYDRDPTGLATRFPSYAASIDYVASQISESYLSPTGKFYGGAATLRGMHYYASDPKWATLIAHIANGIVLPTVAKRGVSFAAPTIGDASTGQKTVVTITTRKGTLPDGLEAAYRFVPVAIVEAGTPTGPIPDADPVFRRASGDSAKDLLKVTVTAPSRPGRYRLELELRDSDGSVLTEYRVPQIPTVSLRVYGSDAVSYDVGQDDNGLTVNVTNEGTRAIPPTGAVVTGTSGAIPAPVPTLLRAWLVDRAGTAMLLGTAQPTRTLKPGATWTAHLPAPDPASMPAVLVLRLEVGGEPKRLGGSPPGVFALAADGSAAPTNASPSDAPDPSASIDPAASPAPPTDPASAATTALAAAANAANAAAQAANAVGVTTPAIGSVTAPTPTASPDPSVAGSSAGPDPAAAKVPLAIGALTPIDASSRVLLNPGWKPSPPKTTGAKASSASSTSGVVRLHYLPFVSPTAAGTATLRISNKGTAALLALPPVDPTATTAPAASNAPVTVSNTPPDTSAVAVLVTAIPAWGPAAETITLQVPLLSDVQPGHSVDVHFTLPSTAGASTYLIVARVLPADGGEPYSATVFWLRSTGPTAAAPAATATTTTTASTPPPVTTGHAPASTPSATPKASTATTPPSAAPPSATPPASITPPATLRPSLPPNVPGPGAIPVPVTLPAPPRAAGPATEIALGGVAPDGATSIVSPAVMAALQAAAPPRAGSR